MVRTGPFISRQRRGELPDRMALLYAGVEAEVDVDGDRAFIQIVDAALAEAARKSGAWLVCRPGCCECCIGPFAITQLDAKRLRTGLAELEAMARNLKPGSKLCRTTTRARCSIRRLARAIYMPRGR